MSLLGNLDLNNITEGYIIVKDVAEGVTVTSNSNNAIKESEFPNRVMEYVNSIYKEKQEYTDSGNDMINSYTIH